MMRKAILTSLAICTIAAFSILAGWGLVTLNHRAVQQIVEPKSLIQREEESKVKIAALLAVEAALINPIDSVVLIETGMFLGSGVVISEDGIILTAAHMLAFGLPDKITFKDGVERTEFELLYIDTDVDIGLFKIKYAFNLPYLSLGDSNELKVGDKIWAIGMPFGEEWWHCYGRISKEPEKGELYVSAALNPGNSGCPILNQDNEIIGICTGGILPGNNMTFGHTSNICTAIIIKYRILYE